MLTESYSNLGERTGSCGATHRAAPPGTVASTHVVSLTSCELNPPPGHAPEEPGSANVPLGAAACPLTDRFSIQLRE